LHVDFFTEEYPLHTIAIMAFLKGITIAVACLSLADANPL
jgi:hypothetical protein